MDVLGALADAAEARVAVHQLRAADQLEECPPLLVVVDHHAQVAVLRDIGLAVLVEQPPIASRAGRRVEGQAAHVVAEDEGGHGLEHRDVDALPLAAAFAVEQRGAHRIHRAHADDAVGHSQWHVARHVGAGLHGQGRQRSRALDQVVVGRLGRVGAALAVAVDADVDDPRVDRRHRRVVQPQPHHRLRAHVVDQHVGIRRQA
ncbi:hypothetical protein D3C81_1349380 [compost metagenome]